MQRNSNKEGLTSLQLSINLVLVSLIIFNLIQIFVKETEHIKLSLLKSHLANVRTAIAFYRIHEILKGQDAFPSLDFIRNSESSNGSFIMQSRNLPDNPFSTGKDKDRVDGISGNPSPSGTETAWAYDAATGKFYANTRSGQGEENL